jgi:hypothetical protein
MRRNNKFLSLGFMIAGLALTSAISGRAQRELLIARLSIRVRDELGNPLRGVSRVRLERADGVLVEESDTDQEGQIRKRAQYYYVR